MSVSDSIYNALLRFGRPMTLRRNTFTAGVRSSVDVTVHGVTRGNKTSPLLAQVTQSDTEVVFTNQEIAAASWPGPPRKDDIVIDGARNLILTGNPEPKYLSTDVLVYVCPVRGG